MKEFKDQMWDIYQQITQGTLKNGDEGAIVYIMRPMGDHSVLAVLLIKNLEYNIVSRLKEKINAFCNSQTKTQKEVDIMLNRFETDL
jgi:L-lactate utilization protein LutC